jgi:multidrug resistance efflux pump
MRSACLVALVALAACTRDPDPAPHAAPQEAAPTNRVDIPEAVRRNLGITFAAVESRRVAQTMRLPGRFELPPEAIREERAALAGRVEPAVLQYQRVEAGAPLYILDAPGWRELQRELEDTAAAIDVARARLASFEPLMKAHELHEAGLRGSVELWESRVAQLEAAQAAGGGKAAELAEAQGRLSDARSAFGEVLEKDAELALRKAETESELRSAEARLGVLTRWASAWISDVPADKPHWWRQVNVIERRAAAPGVVIEVTAASGGWVEAGDLVLKMIDPSKVRFRARALQSDLPRLASGMPAQLVLPHLSSGVEGVDGSIQVAPVADPDERTFDIVVAPATATAWMTPGVAGFVEITLAATAQPELAVPLACVVRDNGRSFIFRRDPKDPDKVIRVEADVGVDDGRWVVIHSGVKAGDQIVLEGAYQLMLASDATSAKGGHFHADGTWHEGSDH